MHHPNKYPMLRRQREKSRILGPRSEGVSASPLGDHPTPRHTGGLDVDVVQQNSPNSAIDSAENLAGKDDIESPPPRQAFPLRRRDAHSGQPSILKTELRREALSQWPVDIVQFPTARSVQSDSGYSSAAYSSTAYSSRKSGGLERVREQSSYDDFRLRVVTEKKSSPSREAVGNVMRQPDHKTESPERPFDPWSYVERMENQIKKTHPESSSIPAVVNYNDDKDDDNKPPPPPPEGPFSDSLHSPVKRTLEELPPKNTNSQRRKSRSGITLDSQRTDTTKKIPKNTSSDIQSTISSSTRSTNRTVDSAVSTGRYSATGTFGMRSDKEGQLGSPFATVPDHSSHTNSYAGGGSGSEFSGLISQVGIHEDGGRSQLKPPRRNLSKKMADSHRVQTDSNYARPSQSTKKKVASGQLPDVTNEGNIMQSPAIQETEDTMKSQGLYPDDRIIIGTKRTQLYISHFANHLYNRLQEQQPLTEDSLDIITRLLPELLVAFGLKLGQTSQSQIKRDAMYFVYTHRESVLRSIRDLFYTNGISLEKRLVSNPVPEAEDDFSTEDLVRHLNVVTKDTAFEWLVGKLGAELNSARVDSSAMKLISSYIQDCLPPIRYNSRQYPSKPYKVTFYVECDIPGFIQEQAYEGSAAEVLPKMITITGSVQDVQATTCEQYLFQTWPLMGCNLLRTIQGALRGGNASEPFQFSCKCKFEDRTEIKVSLGRYMEVEAVGTIHSIAEIGEQIGWLATTFKSPVPDSEIWFCHPEITRFQANDSAESQSMEDDFEQSFVCRINVATDEIRANLPGFIGQCWQQMFNNPVVVMGYPIKPRKDLIAGFGLELPFDMMTTLADARYLTTFEDRTLVKGFSTVLIPTAIHGSIILWHLLVNESGSRISYRDPRIEQAISIEAGNFESARHILGWCMNAQNNIGSLNASYDITWSGLSHGRAALTCEGIELSVGAGNYFKVGTSFKRGKRDRSICGFVSDGYVSLVEHIGQHHVVLYDVNEKRACLSDGLPVLLHLVRTSLRRDEKEDPECLYTNHIERLNEPPSSVQGIIAAKAVLFNSENRLSALRLIETKVTEQIIERIIDSKTVKEIVKIKEETYYRFENRVEEISLLLEKTIDQTTKAIKDGILRHTPKNMISGFDFMGVATRSKLRHITTKIPIPVYSYGWTDLVDSLEAITLFGNNFGELISPRVDDPPNLCDRCGYEASLPPGKHHLAVCVSVLENIIEINGNKDKTGWRLTDDVYWHLNGSAFRLCCSNFNGRRVGARTSNWIQILSSKDIRHYPEYSIPTNAVANGAVIFGHGRPRLISMRRNIKADRKDSLSDKLTQSTTAVKMPTPPVVQDESSETNETQLFDSVSSTTPYSAPSTINGSGLDSNQNLSDTMNPITPDTSGSSTSDEMVLSNTAADQQSPVSGVVYKPPEIISKVITASHIRSNTLPTLSPQKSFGKMKGICSTALKRLKPRKNNRTES